MSGQCVTFLFLSPSSRAQSEVPRLLMLVLCGFSGCRRGTLLAGWSHDYDRVGNKKYQEDLQSAAQSELYGCDAVYRLDDFKRGELNANKDDIVSPSRTQTWALDPLGNWDDTVIDSTTETRSHNSVNELTSRTIGQDPQISLTYDDAGNLTADGSENGDPPGLTEMIREARELHQEAVQSGQALYDLWVAHKRAQAKLEKLLEDFRRRLEQDVGRPGEGEYPPD